MAEQSFTRCPNCRTVFRVTPQQLALRGGQVRCGHCRTVFDGLAARVSLAPQPRLADEEPEFDEEALGPPTVTLRDARALESLPAPAAETPERVAEAALPSSAAGTAPPTEDQGEDEDEKRDKGLDAEAAYAARFSWQEKRARRWLPGWVYALALPLLLLTLGGQVLFHFGSAIAAYWPRTKPALIRVCSALGCKVHALQEISGVAGCSRDDDCGLSIEADVQADPAHKGLLILSATIRNRGPYALAYPHLELTLSDVDKRTQQEVVVVRRDFAPQEYVSGAPDLDGGIPGNGELGVKLFIDASATAQSGYQVYLFYP